MAGADGVSDWGDPSSDGLAVPAQLDEKSRFYCGFCGRRMEKWTGHASDAAVGPG